MEYIDRIVGKIRIKLNANIMRKSLVTALMYGAVAGLIVVIASMIFPFYYAGYVALAAIFLGLLVGVFLGIRRRIDNKAAALYIDSCGFDEKIITALENRKYKDKVCILQRIDAEQHLKLEESKVKVKFELPWIKLGVLLLVMVLATVLYMIPTPAKELAKNQHEAKQEAKKAQEEVEEMMEALTKIDQGEMTPEELEELKQMMESLKTSKEDFANVKDRNDFNKARQKYDYKLGDMSDKLEMLSQGKTGEAQKELKSAKEIADNQNQKPKNQTASNNQQGEPGQEGQQGEPGQQGQEGQEGQQGQQGQEGQQGQQGQEGQEGQQGQQGQEGQEGEPGQEGQEGQGGEGQGEGEGEGQGKGEGKGSGEDEGEGQGKGKGSGQGEGSSETKVKHNHDYVSVNENVSGQYTENSTSEFAHEQNGLAWEGTQVPYDTVIGDYSDKAYEGIDKGKYPGGMSDVIKNYFTGLSE